MLPADGLLLSLASLLVCVLPGAVALVRSGKTSLRHAVGITPTSKELQALYALDAIYKGRSTSVNETDHHANEAHRDVYNASGDAAASVYGEIQPEAVLEMLRITGAKEEQKYYDLGSGYGKTVVLAWLLGLNATGVELASDRWQASCAALRHAPEVGVSGPGNGISFIRASFFDVDFSDADIVFMDSVMFSDETMEGLAQAARRCRPGTKIVSSHMGLPGPGFRKLGMLQGSVSWTHRKSRWTIQAVVNSLEQDAPRGAAANASSSGGHPSTCTI